MNKIAIVCVLGVAIFLLSGSYDFLNVATGGLNLTPKITAFTPIAVMLSVFGLTGAYFLIQSPKNIKSNERLANIQQTVGLAMLLSVAFLFELAFRIAMT